VAEQQHADDEHDNERERTDEGQGDTVTHGLQSYSTRPSTRADDPPNTSGPSHTTVGLPTACRVCLTCRGQET